MIQKSHILQKAVSYTHLDVYKRQMESSINCKEEYIVNVQSGMALGKLSQILLKNEIGGFEFASGIPGTIGGAIKMNAGAYGGEFKDIIQDVIYLNEQNDIVVIQNTQCDFSYRHLSLIHI